MPMHNPLATAVALSAVAEKVISIDSEDTYKRLVVDAPGSVAARSTLEALKPDDLFVGPMVSQADAAAALAGLWLRHDWLDQAHRIVQHIETPTGSFWHAIMHRREGGFSNSRYWYRRTEEHPLGATLAIRVGEAINPHPADNSVFRIIAQGWNPAALVDLVEQVHGHPDDPRHALAVAIQEIEWRSLFEYCARAAAGR